MAAVTTQNQTDDWKLGSKGCYDAASLAKLQCTLDLDFPSVAEVRQSADVCAGALLMRRARALRGHCWLMAL